MNVRGKPLSSMMNMNAKKGLDMAAAAESRLASGQSGSMNSATGGECLALEQELTQA